MNEEVPSRSAASAEKPGLDDRPPQLRRHLVELFVVLCVAVFPDIMNAISSVLLTVDELAFQMDYFEADGLFLSQTIGLIGRSVCVIAAVLYIMHTAPEPFSGFGFRKPRWVFDFVAGCALYILCLALYWCVGTGLATVLYAVGIEIPNETAYETGAIAPPSGSTAFAQTIAFSLFNGVAEQLVITAYLITRFRSIFGVTWPGVIIATGLFASYHIYQGFWGTFWAAIFGLALTSSFAVVRRIWYCFVAHFLGDLVPTVLAMIDYSTG